MPGGAEGGGGLGGALLGFAQLGDGLGERGQPDDKHDRGEPAVPGEVGVRGDEPGGMAELVPYRGRGGHPPVGLAGGTVERVGSLPQCAAAERGGGYVQRVGRSIGGVGGGCGVGGGVEPYLGGGIGGGAGGVLPQGFRLVWRSAAESGRAGPVHRWVSLGQDRSAASLPPPYHTASPSLVVSPGSATAYPVTCPGFFTLYRTLTCTPAWPRRAKNSSALAAVAAAVATWRRSVTRGGSPSPRRSAFPVSARVGARAAVRSAGAVDLSPYRCSAAMQASRTR